MNSLGRFAAGGLARTPVWEGDPGLLAFQTPLWRTNCLLVLASGFSLAVDVNFTSTEIEAVRDIAEAHGSPVRYYLLTHADYDHCCGIPYFPKAHVLSGPESEARISSGSVAVEVAQAADEWGTGWFGGDLRVDRIVHGGDVVGCDGIQVEVMDARGHEVDGVGYVLPNHGVAIVGDYLSSVAPPFAIGSVAHSIATLERIRARLGDGDIAWVVPGHGPVLSRESALRIAAEDLGYLAAIRLAAARAVNSGRPSGCALLDVFAVNPPRSSLPEFDLFGIRIANSRKALAEAQTLNRADAPSAGEG